MPKYPTTVKWIGKLWYLYLVQYCHNENEESTSTQNNMNESHKLNIDWKKIK